MTYELTAAHGAQIKIGSGTSPETFTAIKGVHNGPNGPSWDTNVIEARHHGSNVTFKKPTYVNTGSVTFSVYYDSTDTQHQQLLTDAAAMAKRNFKVIINDPGDEEYHFAAFIGLTFRGDVDGWNVYDVTLNIDGDITVS